jgi:hypothetical protein
VAQVSIRDCVVDTGTPGGAQSQPSAGTVGVILPKINNWVISEIYNMDVRGYDIGYQINEHADVDDARVWICNYGWYFPGGTHSVHMGHTVTAGVTRGVIGGPAGGFVQRIIWDNYAVEHSILTTNSSTGSAIWANSVADFCDTNSVLRGQVNFAAVQSGVGAVDSLTVLGTTNVTFYNENNHAFAGLKVSPLATNDSLTYPLLEATRSNGVPIFAIGQYQQPFERFSGVWLGAGQPRDVVSVATNFTIIGDGTNETTINVGQPLGGNASKSVIQIQVGHVTVATYSNNVITLVQPLNHGFIGLSNFVSGQFYTNKNLSPININASLQLISAAVSGATSMNLWMGGFSGGFTNLVGYNTSVTSIAEAADYRTLEGNVAPGGWFVYTNTSTGAGNSVTLFKTQVTGD